MLKSLEELIGYRLQATDGEIGRVKDIYFDDGKWGIRYFVVDTGKWLPGRKVLISPEQCSEPDWQEEEIPVSLTTQQIEDSPTIDQDMPVSRQHQAQLAKYYNWTPYWGGFAAPATEWLPAEPEQADIERDPDLRSLKEVLHYRIQATDGEIGHVEDFIAQMDGWVIRYMVVDTRKWLPGKNVLLSPAWIKDLLWAEAHVVVDVEKQSIENAPEYDPDQPVDREYELRLYDYYGRAGYWQ